MGKSGRDPDPWRPRASQASLTPTKDLNWFCPPSGRGGPRQIHCGHVVKCLSSPPQESSARTMRGFHTEQVLHTLTKSKRIPCREAEGMWDPRDCLPHHSSSAPQTMGHSQEGQPVGRGAWEELGGFLRKPQMFSAKAPWVKTIAVRMTSGLAMIKTGGMTDLQAALTPH